jgi:hypothetical protein
MIMLSQRRKGAKLAKNLKSYYSQTKKPLRTLRLGESKYQLNLAEAPSSPRTFKVIIP